MGRSGKFLRSVLVFAVEFAVTYTDGAHLARMIYVRHLGGIVLINKRVCLSLYDVWQCLGSVWTVLSIRRDSRRESLVDTR